MTRVNDAVVHIREMENWQIVRDYYLHGGHDAVLPFFDLKAKTERHIVTFSTFEQLLENLSSHGLSYHIVVCHGNEKEGLLVRFMKDSDKANATGPAMAALSQLADMVQKYEELEQQKEPKGLLGLQMRMSDQARQLQNPIGAPTHEAVMRLAYKLVAVRKSKLLVLFRGCNLAANGSALPADYHRALGTLRLFSPKVKNGFVQVDTSSASAVSPQTLEGKQNEPDTAITRKRSFPPRTKPAEMVLEVTDGGPGKFSSTTFTNNSASVPAMKWARQLNREWHDAKQQFVTSVMWAGTGLTYFCASDPFYTSELAVNG